MAVRPGVHALLMSVLFLCLPETVRAQEIAAVLSSELRPYMEAYDGFREALGYPVPVVSLSAGEPRISSRTRVVVAFGSKAAQEEYPDEVVLIYCMAPGTVPEMGQRSGSTVHIGMIPQPKVLVETLQDIQPQLRRLAVCWMLQGFSEYIEQLRQVAAPHQIELVGTRLEGAEELPDRLRALMEAKVEALWLPPDPLLITAQSFAVLREFSHANDVPLYAPTAGFVAEGAAVSVAVSFARVGREAAVVAKRALAGGPLPQEVYPEHCEIFLNLEAATASGLRVPDAVIHRASKVVR